VPSPHSSHPEYPGQPASTAGVSVMKRLTWSLASFGRPRLRRQALELLIAVTDLPGTGWRELHTGSWRIGVGAGQSGPVAKRARKTGAFTAIRRFRNDETSRGVMVQIIPLADSEDARAQVRESRTSIVRWNGVTTLAERTIDDISVPMTDALLAWERLNEREGYGQGYSRTIAANVGQRAFFVSCTSLGEGCQWSEVVEIAASQAKRLA